MPQIIQELITDSRIVVSIDNAKILNKNLSVDKLNVMPLHSKNYVSLFRWNSLLLKRFCRLVLRCHAYEISNIVPGTFQKFRQSCRRQRFLMDKNVGCCKGYRNNR